MSSLSKVEAKLPPGFRFHPRDEELICDYLMKRVAGCAHPFPLLIEVDLNKSEPWDIPESACVGGKDWYFYSQRDRKYATGLRTNRATASGYWKATGKDKPVITRNGTRVGMRKTLVFYQGRAPKGSKTDWVMHEFRLEGPGPRIPSAKEDWVLCRVFFKNGSDNPAKLQETDTSYPPSSSSSLPPLMDPYITFEYTQANAYDEYNEQVPCFSNFTLNPTFSLITQKIMPNFGELITPDLGIYDLTKIKNSNEQSSVKGSPPSFGEGSSDSTYLSELELSSMWNIQYS